MSNEDTNKTTHHRAPVQSALAIYTASYNRKLLVKLGMLRIANDI